LSQHIHSLPTRALAVATATAATVLFPAPASAAPAPVAQAAPATVAPATAAPGTGGTPLRINLNLPGVAALADAAAPFAARASALKYALSKVGAPYRYGAAGPHAFDCSGLVYWSFKQAGISLPRSSRAQSRVGKPVSRDQLRPGDLVFFYKPVSHVGIYIGDGKNVHASTRKSPVKISDMAGKRYNSARRIA
jgi:cell wall-associated NlpC family hydrolase